MLILDREMPEDISEDLPVVILDPVLGIPLGTSLIGDKIRIS